MRFSYMKSEFRVSRRSGEHRFGGPSSMVWTFPQMQMSPGCIQQRSTATTIQSFVFQNILEQQAPPSPDDVRYKPALFIGPLFDDSLLGSIVFLFGDDSLIVCLFEGLQFISEGRCGRRGLILDRCRSTTAAAAHAHQKN